MAPLTPAVRDGLIEQFRGFAKAIAYDLAPSLPIELDDAISVAYEGLIQAANKLDADRFDPKRGPLETNFKSLAYMRIRGAIFDEVRKTSFVKRRGHEKGLKFDMISLNKTRTDSDGHLSPVLEIPVLESFDPEYREALDALSDRERFIILGQVAGYTNIELAEHLGVSHSRVSQLGTKARRKLVEYLR